jgi:hypothetical protein
VTEQTAAEYWRTVARDEITKRVHLEHALRLSLALHPDLASQALITRALDLVESARP